MSPVDSNSSRPRWGDANPLPDLDPGVPGPARRPRFRPPVPMLPVALGIILGIVEDATLALPTWVSGVLTAAGALMLLITLRRASDPVGRAGGRSTHGRLAFAALMLAAAGVGSLRHAIADRRLPANHIFFFSDDVPILTELRGRILTPPAISEPQPGVPRAFPSGPKTRFVMEATRIAGRDAPIAVQGKVAAGVKGAALFLHVGDEVAMTGWLYRPPGPSNPGAHDWARRQRRSGLWVGVSCDHAESVIVQNAGGTGGWRGLLHSVRLRLRRYLLDDAFEPDEPAAGVISAMVLGERSAVPRAMNEAFVKTGNAHFLAASGMHVGWLALIGWGICRILGLYYRHTAVVVGLLILSYALTAEPRPSILRAGIIGELACLTAYARGRYNSINALACAAVLILLIQPTDLFHPAFQFSFMATLGLLHFCPLVSKTLASILMRMRLPRVARPFDSRAIYSLSLMEPRDGEASTFSRMRHWIAFFAAQLFALTISEWIITTPLACYHFNRFAPWGWFGAMVLWFLAMPATCIGFLTILLRLVFPSSGVILGPILSCATRLLVGCVERLAQLPWAILDGRSPSLAWLLAVYGLLWMWGYRRRPMPWKHGFKVLTLILVLWWCIPPRWTHPAAGALRVWVLDVGAGSGTVIELPNGKVLVYDLGTRSDFNAGSVGVAMLKHRGIQRLDTVFVSHANFDHYGGIETLAGHFAIGRLVISDQFDQFAPEGSAARRFLETTKRLGIPVEVTHGRHRFEGMGEATVEAIWPPPAEQRPVPNSNESSTVLRIGYQGRSILLTGDIAEVGMGVLLAGGSLKTDALTLPHHGGVVRNTGRFIEAADPQVVVRSSGQSRAMTTNGIVALVGEREFFNTADDGCVLLEIRDGELTAKAVRSGDKM